MDLNLEIDLGKVEMFCKWDDLVLFVVNLGGRGEEKVKNFCLLKGFEIL